MEPKHLNTYPRLDPKLLQNELRGKSILITGGGHGIGAAIAQSFVEAGVASIILIGRTESKLVATVQKLRTISTATQISFYLADISSKDDVKHLFDDLSRLTTPIDVLINNAGYLTSPANFVDADLDEFWKVFMINVYGTALVTQCSSVTEKNKRAKEQTQLW